MAQLLTAAELLRRLGAVPPETAVRLLVEACEELQAHGRNCALTLQSLEVSEEPGTHARVRPSAFTGAPDDLDRAQVRAVAAIGYELLRGMPPPAQADSSAWFGVRPELVSLLSPALAGSGAPNVAELAHQLRTLARPATAEYAPALPVGDTAISARPSRPTPADKWIGQLLGSWELLERLGSGGMGDVYRARHVKLGREAAVKLLKPEYAADPEIVHRFFDEARVVNEINHPHIVEIHDFVEEPGRVYCVMELLSGRSLAQLIAEEGPLPPRRVAAIFAQVCDALQAAHARGVVHRDIKPDNIFVTLDPAGSDFARVLDFGVARRLSGDGRTQQGLVLGTLYFMAPEQAAGRPVDGRADLYAVGVSMVEALTGRPPSEGTAVVPTQTPRGEPLHPSLIVLLQRCLSLDPVGRPRTAAELREGLRLLEGDAPKRPTTDSLQRAAGVGPSSRAGLKLGAAAGVLLLAGAAVFVERDALFDGAGGEIAVAPPPKSDPAPPPHDATAEVKPAEPAPAEHPRTQPVAAPVRHRLNAGKLTRAAPAAVAEAPASPPKEEHPYQDRVAAVQRRYDQLVKQYGESQLTTLERAAVRQALDDAHSGRDTRLAASIPPAEAALDAAANRLSR